MSHLSNRAGAQLWSMEHLSFSKENWKKRLLVLTSQPVLVHGVNLVSFGTSVLVF